MRAVSPELQQHLNSGVTTLCRCWKIIRKDGRVLGFCDHDEDIKFDGVRFEAASGLNAAALHLTSGLSVDNTEVLGALNSNRICAADIDAGAYDAAHVWQWLVNWRNTFERVVIFRGIFGEIRHGPNDFEAELRGLSETLNKPFGHVYTYGCSANLGDHRCRFNVKRQGFFINTTIIKSKDNRIIYPHNISQFKFKWFTFGQVQWMSGKNINQTRFINAECEKNVERGFELNTALPYKIEKGDRIHLAAGCDKTTITCRKKFNNLINFQGFPFIPGEDWLIAYPLPANNNNGGKRPRSVRL